MARYSWRGSDGDGPRVNVVISHAYSRENKGDAAIVSVLIDQIRKEFDPKDIVIMTMERTSKGDCFEGVPLESNFSYLALFRFRNRAAKLSYTAWMIALTFTWAAIFRATGRRSWLPKDLTGLVNAYSDADLIIAVGGGYLRGTRNINSILNVVLTLHPMVLSRLLRKPTVLYSQSIGPFYHEVEMMMVKVVMNTCISLCLVREEKSMDFARKAGLKRVVRSVDAGFLLEGRESAADLWTVLGVAPGCPVVGVTARQWLQADGQTKYEAAMASLVDHIVERHNARVVFIPQVTAAFFGDDDRVVHRAIVELVRNQDRVTVLEEDYDCHAIKSLYGGLFAMVGTRFHSVIFALTSAVPAVAIEYEYKTSGIMGDLGLSEWVVPIEAVSASNLQQMTDRLLAERQAYLGHLEDVLPKYVDEARGAIRLTREAYEAHKRNSSIAG